MAGIDTRQCTVRDEDEWLNSRTDGVGGKPICLQVVCVWYKMRSGRRECRPVTQFELALEATIVAKTYKTTFFNVGIF